MKLIKRPTYGLLNFGKRSKGCRDNVILSFGIRDAKIAPWNQTLRACRSTLGALWKEIFEIYG